MMNDTELVRWAYPQMKAAAASEPAPFAVSAAAPGSAPFAASSDAALMEYELLYPDIYYQVQPFVVEACDQMDACGGAMPCRDMLRKMGDQIEMQFTAPDMAAMAQAVPDAAPAALRSRGLFRDLLDILLLQELFGRRRRYYY